jgi:hypothetical protein
MMRGLLLLHQRGDKFIEIMDFPFGKGDTGSGFREKTEVFFIGIYCKIKVLFEGAGKTILAGIADIRWFKESVTELSLEVLAESVAHGATFAEFVSALCVAARADTALLAGKTERAGVKVRIFTACALGYEMGTDLFRNRGRILIKGKPNLCK